MSLFPLARARETDLFPMTPPGLILLVALPPRAHEQRENDDTRFGVYTYKNVTCEKVSTETIQNMALGMYSSRWDELTPKTPRDNSTLSNPLPWTVAPFAALHCSISSRLAVSGHRVIWLSERWMNNLTTLFHSSSGGKRASNLARLQGEHVGSLNNLNTTGRMTSQRPDRLVTHLPPICSSR